MSISSPFLLKYVRPVCFGSSSVSALTEMCCTPSRAVTPSPQSLLRHAACVVHVAARRVHGRNTVNVLFACHCPSPAPFSAFSLTCLPFLLDDSANSTGTSSTSGKRILFAPGLEPEARPFHQYHLLRPAVIDSPSYMRCRNNTLKVLRSIVPLGCCAASFSAREGIHRLDHSSRPGSDFSLPEVRFDQSCGVTSFSSNLHTNI